MTTEEPRQEEQGPRPRDREAVDWWLAKWGRAEPLTGEDVRRLTEVNGGTAEGLELGARDLQGIGFFGANLEGIVLSGANLRGASLWGVNLRRAVLLRANLQDATLISANLQDAGLLQANLQDVCFSGANLQGAKLWGANLRGANLIGASLEGTDFESSTTGPCTSMESVSLSGATTSETTRFRRVFWGDSTVLGDELQGQWDQARDVYRGLKQWHQRAGDYDTADRFQYREWECRRKVFQQQKKPVETLELWLYRLLSGYGARPWRVVLSGALAVLLFALLYMPWSLAGISAADGARDLFTFTHFGKALYFSGVSFTAVGYGGWVDSPAGWTKYLGVIESLVGIFLIALFLVTFTRKMSR